MHLSLLLPLLPLIPPTTAHGRITNITTASGLVYQGWDPELALRTTPPPPLAAWTASNLGNIFVPPSQFNTSAIICHYNATPGALHVNASAGEALTLQWNEWPVSHKGPVLTYLAACNGSCAAVQKERLEWVKVDQQGWLNSSGWDGLGGTWASDVLIANRAAWMVKLPSQLAEGYYVLRHEIIALHVANETDGAQAYPQCVNVRVGKGGAESIEGGVVGSKLYGMGDKGILVDIHHKLTGYSIPGPNLWKYATPVKQANEKRWFERRRTR
ncbi:lytic polysaccharide monooxygenase [Trematosphaeria pertusa]|uniref:Lytic polysaccharide monooxygenase n=1 Tax=Trematosphaeria pertusa TaxID=390896 RepID=A0A6A6IGD2_9PLEO|nr:lytic polysaccharide monooxygenase [Trematosphaeria pertusa]KAF2249269.1 lytic polysaccharide monooxygenase [Trematosphaeria pertusa]